MEGVQAWQLTPEAIGEIRKLSQKSVIKYCDMHSESAIEASDLIVSSLDKHSGNFEAASRAIKEAMDKKFGEAWNVIVGEGFSFEIAHQSNHVMYLFYQNIAVLLFKF